MAILLNLVKKARNYYDDLVANMFLNIFIKYGGVLSTAVLLVIHNTT